MPCKEKPSYVVEFALDTTSHDERRLTGVFDAAKRLTNAVLQSGLAILDALRNDPDWAAARKLPQKTEEERVVRREAFKSVRLKHKFSDYSFQDIATAHKKAAGFSDRLGSHVTQKIGTCVFKALEKHLFGNGGRPRFKGQRRPLHSIEGKNTAAAPRWNAETRVLTMEAGWAIPAAQLRLDKDEWLWAALQGKLKYTRVLWRNVGLTRAYFVQLIFEGVAPKKASVLAQLAPQDAEGALDMGPTNLAYCTPTDAGVQKFAAEVDLPQKEIRVLQRQVDRQRRSNNPDNFDEKGRAKRGRKWVKSRRQAHTEKRLCALHRRAADKRKQSHGHAINGLLGHARHFRHDGVSVKSLQKNYGRSVGARAPGLFMSELKRKAESAGGKSETVNVRQLKTSQYDHSTGDFVKKKLSERKHVFGDGRGYVQRDVYSAFLALHAVETVDADGVVTWTHDRERLEAAWVVLAPALQAKGLFVPKDGKGVSHRGASIVPSADPHSPDNCEAPALRPVPGRPSRRAVRAKCLYVSGLSL